MYCLRCGREVPDGELFCAECGKQPLERESAPVKEAPKPAEPAPKATPKPAPKPVPQPRVSAPVKKQKKLWIIPVVILSVLLLAESVAVIKLYQHFNVQKANYRVKEANLAARESEIAEIEDNYNQTLSDLELAQLQLAERDTEISALRQELLEHETAMSQSTYDAEAAERTIETLTEENTALVDENETLLEEKTTLEEEKTDLELQLEAQVAATAQVQADLEEMTGLYGYASQKATFMDNYVVFVNNNGTKYYHDYDCSQFSKFNFWAYSRKLAENQGYTACPNCGG